MKRGLLMIVAIFTIIATMQAQIRVLFIGDSITDGNWGNSCGMPKSSDERSQWDMNHIYGSGYMYLCATHFQGDYPELNYQFFNRGISGNTLSDLQERWQKDVIEIKPDVLSILIGTNDVSKCLDNGGTQFDIESWIATYKQLIDEAIAANPNLKIVLCAPFVANTGNMKKSDNFDLRQAMVKQCAISVENIAKRYNATFIAYDKLFESLHQNNANIQETYWIWDGIHPTPAGHKRMANLWIEQFSQQQ